MKSRCWQMWERVAYSIPNLNYGEAFSCEEAETMVRTGTHRWKFGQGGVLACVPADSKLLMWESWLQETSPGRFEVVETRLS